MRCFILLALFGFVALAVGQNVDDVVHEAVTLDLAPKDVELVENSDVPVAEEKENEVPVENTDAVKIPKRFRRPIFGAGKKSLRRQLTRDAIKGRGRKLTKEIREAIKLQKNKPMTLELASEDAQAVENSDVPVAEETENEVPVENTDAVKIPKRFRRPIFGAGKKSLRRQLTRDAIKGRGRKLTKEIREAIKLQKNKPMTLELASEDAQAVDNTDLPVAEETGNEVAGDNTGAVKIPKRFRRPSFGAGKRNKRRHLARDAIKGRGRKVQNVQTTEN